MTFSTKQNIDLGSLPRFTGGHQSADKIITYILRAQKSG